MRRLTLLALLLAGCGSPTESDRCETTGRWVMFERVDTLHFPDGSTEEVVMAGEREEPVECDLSEPWCHCLDG